MDARETRLARNETLFREVNERIEEAVGRLGRHDGHVYEFLCECSNADCTLLLPLTIAEYEAVRRDPRQFFVAPDTSCRRSRRSSRGTPAINW